MYKQESEIILQIQSVSVNDIEFVGGKAAALGELIQNIRGKGTLVPPGLVVTRYTYEKFLEYNGIQAEIESLMRDLDPDNAVDMEFASKRIETIILAGNWPQQIAHVIVKAVSQLSPKEGVFNIAVRSSGTAEDLPSASFAGMYSTEMINGGDDIRLLKAIQYCFASAFTPRAIAYRNERKIDHLSVALPVIVQNLVYSTEMVSGVAFTVDLETGFDGGIVINANYGLGDSVVGGKTIPDEFLVAKEVLSGSNSPIIGKQIGQKQVATRFDGSTSFLDSVAENLQNAFCLTDKHILEVASLAKRVEEYFSKKNNRFSPMDIEWAISGPNGQLYLLQARPITSYTEPSSKLVTYEVINPEIPVIASGLPIGRKIGQGKAMVINSPLQQASFGRGDILVTEMTDPAWIPLMKRASGIVTARGGRTCHAAIVAREMGIPCIVGVASGTSKIKSNQMVSVVCSEGPLQGKVTSGLVEFKINETPVDIPAMNTKVMILSGLPDAALVASRLPSDGVGMGREEFIVSAYIGIHPLAFVNHHTMKRELAELERICMDYKLEGLNEVKAVIEAVEKRMMGYENAQECFVQILAQGIGKICAAVYPNEVLMKLCDFKSNEFRALIGGYLYEPIENNPMIGWRSASRYYSEQYRPAFEMECNAFKYVREQMGFDNMHIMIPFCRSVEEGKKVIEALKTCGIIQHKDGLKIIAETEVPASVIEAKEYAEVFDGFAIGSNDLAQMVLGTDRDSELLSHIFDERNSAVKKFIRQAIEGIHAASPKTIAGKIVKPTIGLVGQAPSDYPEFADFLVECGIDFISLNPDPETFLRTKLRIAEVEAHLREHP